MKAEEIRALLLQLLEDSGAEWTEAGGCLLFRLRRGGAVWDMACRCLDGRMLAYGRCPAAAADRTLALERCNEINRQVVQGGMFLMEDGRTAFRTEADLPDPYDAAARLREAIEYNAAVINRFWHLLMPEHPNL